MNIWIIISAIAGFGSFCLSIAVLLLGRYVANKLMYNDLAHLSADVKEVKACIDKVGERLDIHAERISTIEGQLRS
jgi:hypothetical protein